MKIPSWQLIVGSLWSHCQGQSKQYILCFMSQIRRITRELFLYDIFWQQSACPCKDGIYVSAWPVRQRAQVLAGNQHYCRRVQLLPLHGKAGTAWSGAARIYTTAAAIQRKRQPFFKFVCAQWLSSDFPPRGNCANTLHPAPVHSGPPWREYSKY